MSKNRKSRTGKKRTEKKLRKVLRDNLRHQYLTGQGMKRKGLKDIHNRTPYIHSDSTYKTYVKQVERFVKWCQEKGYKHLTKDIDYFVAEYIEDMQKDGLAPHTQAVALCAIAKALNRSTTSFDVELDKRNRDDYTRSRGIKERDKHFSEENNIELVTICRCFGFRNNKELQEVRASDFYKKKGELYCHVKGKGGKLREAKAYYDTNEERLIVEEYLIKHPKGKLFPPSKVHTAADVHDYRAQYAGRVYNHFARDTRTLPRSERYHKRTGEVFDKKALGEASKALGHGKHRYTDMVNSYSRYCKQFE